MSRIAKKPLEIPKGVDFSLENSVANIKGKNGQFSYKIDDAVRIEIENNLISISAKRAKHPMVGTTRVLLGNMLEGVSKGFQKKLKLVGVGYRAELKGNVLEFKLGFSHAKNYTAPEGIRFETPAPTEIVVIGMDKQKVGQVAADIREIRPPEAYKGKGVRYADEVIILKEIKKK
jgi:large subunit ribosomal protein L6